MSDEQQDSAAERAERQAANLARHLNERHPDTVLFLARFAAGQRSATTAALVAVDTRGVTLTTDSSSDPLHLPAAAPPGEPADARSGVRALLAATRARHQDQPLTSLEQAMGQGGQGAGPPH